MAKKKQPEEPAALDYRGHFVPAVVPPPAVPAIPNPWTLGQKVMLVSGGVLLGALVFYGVTAYQKKKKEQVATNPVRHVHFGADQLTPVMPSAA